MEAAVLIVGAGPVGLTLAMDLAQRGIEVLVTERRAPGESPAVDSLQLSGRSMDSFRRLGVAGDVRAAGLPPDYPHDVVLRTSFTGIELARIPMAQSRHPINLIQLDPILFKHARACAGVRILSRTRIDALAQDADGVVASGVGLDSGAPVRIRCRYLVGCDGAGSTVRRAMHVLPSAPQTAHRVRSSYLRSPALIGLQQGASGWSTQVFNPQRCGQILPVDGRETWLVHVPLPADEPELGCGDAEQAIRQVLGVGRDFRFELLGCEDRVGSPWVAERFRDGRMFICGDAAHAGFPGTGDGINAGIADAASLSALLTADLLGRGERGLLDDYDRERRPAAECLSARAKAYVQSLARQRAEIPAEIAAPGVLGDAIRAVTARALIDIEAGWHAAAIDVADGLNPIDPRRGAIIPQ